MKRDIADKWTAALRSGDYEQGQHALHSNGAFCCLGVLCELHRQEVGGEWSKYQSAEAHVRAGDLTYVTANGDWDYSLLPEDVAEWAELASTNPGIPAHSCLSHRNDDGWSFTQIADVISQRWRDL